MEKVNITKIRKTDFKEAIYIYNYYIINSLSNFEENRFSLIKFTKMVKEILQKKLPFIVCKSNKKVVGIAFLSPFRNKSGYRFTFENTIYVHPRSINKGIGNILLKNLIIYSKKNNKIKNIVAVIGETKNKSSIIIHKKNGFKKIGTLKKVGFKNNKWINAIYMQKEI